MHLKKLKIGNTGKRVVLVDMKFIHGTDDCPITEHKALQNNESNNPILRRNY